MKLRNPILIRVVALLVSWVVRAWTGTLSYRVLFEDGSKLPRLTMRRGVHLFWHETLLIPTPYASGFSILISQHADGELISRIVGMMGGRTIRGSTSKAGLSALRELMRVGKVFHLAITPDGPRGPRRVMKPGAVYLASRTGMPIIVVGMAARDCWRNRSWDKLVVPKPGTVVVVVVGSPLQIPADLDRAGIDFHMRRAQEALDSVQAKAEALALRRQTHAAAPVRPAGVGMV